MIPSKQWSQRGGGGAIKDIKISKYQIDLDKCIKRKIIWFNALFNLQININSLAPLNKHFPANNLSNKIFNMHEVITSYSATHYKEKIIKGHKQKVLRGKCKYKTES